jgi:ADP-heptose:LPS heptosyltransferase
LPRKKILILRFSSMGDVVLTSPVVRCLNEQADVEIHYLTKTVFADLLTENPHIKRVWTFDKEPDSLFSELRSQQFDHIIDLHNNLRSLKVKLALSTSWSHRPKLQTFPKLRIARFLLTQMGIDIMPKKHITELYMEAVKTLGVQYDGLGLDYFLPENTTLSQSTEFNLVNYEIFAVGATHYTKRLPTESIIKICQNRSLPIVLIGGKQEAQTGLEIAAACGSQVINLCGQVTLHQSALLVRGASTVLTHDTGMMHIAAAFGKPIISFWGSTHHQLGFWPLYSQGTDLNKSIEMADLSCRPCTKFGRANCPKGHFKCMRDLDLSQVMQTNKF